MGSKLAEKTVYFHGIWKAGYRVSDKLIQSIANDIATKPSRLFTLHLTTAGLTLEAPPSNDGKTRRTDQVAFSSLRDISVNMYQRTCLLIIYVDSSNKFSVMACSHQDEKELQEIAMAFRQQKNALLKSVHPETQTSGAVNWILRQNQRPSPDANAAAAREHSIQSNVSNGIGHAVNNNVVLSKNALGASSRSNYSVHSMAMNEFKNDDDVFGVSRAVLVHDPEYLKRIPVDGGDHADSAAFNVEVQTVPYEEDFDMDSITSAVSQMSAVSSDTQGTVNQTAKGSEISSDQYFHLKNSQGHRRIEEIHLSPKPSADAQHTGGPALGHDRGTTHEEHGGNHQPAVNGNSGATSYHLRSLGIQTINNSKLGRRYAKKNMSRNSSNSYKEKIEAIRKRSSSAGPRSPTSPGPNPAGNPNVPPQSSRSSVVSGARQQRTSVADSNTSNQTMKRTMSLGTTTVLKSIEDVYSGRSARRAYSSRGQRPINLIIYSPSSPNNAM